MAIQAGVTTGAVDDIRQATDMAYRIVAEYGLSPRIGPLSVAALATGGDAAGGMAWRDAQGGLADAVDSEVKGMLETALMVARETLEMNSKVLGDLADTLEAEEKLQGEALAQKLAHVKIPPALRRFVEGEEGWGPAQQATGGGGGGGEGGGWGGGGNV